jgi:hypothetical protein
MSSQYSDYSEEETVNETNIIEIVNGSEEMQSIILKINESIKELRIPPFIDESFVLSIIESDISANIKFFKITARERNNILVSLDELNNLYLPFNVFLTAVIPAYLKVQLRTAFSEATSIKEILNEIASVFQDEIERITLDVSEEEFKDAKFNKKDMSTEEIDNILVAHTTTKKESETLDDCPLCGNEKVNHYYECVNCQYKYCADCCKEIASRQATCPCCREDLSLIEYNH